MHYVDRVPLLLTVFPALLGSPAAHSLNTLPKAMAVAIATSSTLHLHSSLQYALSSVCSSPKNQEHDPTFPHLNHQRTHPGAGKGYVSNMVDWTNPW